MIRCVVYLLLIFKMVHGLMNNPVYMKLVWKYAHYLTVLASSLALHFVYDKIPS
jgi:hypothetical protein